MKKQKTSNGEKERRCFSNEFSNYQGKEGLIDENGEVTSRLASRINEVTERLLGEVDSAADSSPDIRGDGSVYTGVTGIALLHLHLHKVYGKQKHLDRAGELVSMATKNLRGRKPAFLNGDGGCLAIAAVVCDKLEQKDKTTKFVAKLKALKDAMPDDTPFELMNGWSGYLFALLYVRAHLGASSVPDDTLNQVATTLLEEGRKFSRRSRSASPLMYEWHGKQYLGACHGISGILSLLLQCQLPSIQEHLTDLVKPSVDFLLSLQFPSGNFPSSISSPSDRLVHWCHGAPGVIHMLLLAFKVFKDDKYLDSAIRCSNDIWKYGLLKKGYGLCHGPAGNGYAFLALYQATKDVEQLHRACKFAEWCLEFGKHGCSQPDRPFSLFEGSAGTIYFLTDLLNPLEARFPCMYI